MAGQSNLAYDLAMFDEGARKRAQYERQRAQLQVVEKKASKEKKSSPVKGLLVSIFAISVCCAMLYSQVEINELYSEINTESNQLEMLRSDNVRLQAKIDERMSLRNVEEYASDVLGLQKIDKSQIEHITIDFGSTVVVDKNQNVGFFGKLEGSLNDFMEYIGF
ncbi:MAG TPA: hypothetical protein VJX95_00810 [Oscillospiraceae bacterium]|nr:hypothetical protein [Oscillospiraceae bacterium]